ncbi:PocR ligand-binding domain-containing protein [Geopsychrobacter electrodiphilus]|uniref:PocR ligand-binding domain-containing protein n=1 Tax=Geopsychrobacter electrodiphilus TaxID=225196 RepID=UPI00037F7AD6|nr:PAS domain S-box protein [Geopsychrobacter electrodiphilus]
MKDEKPNFSGTERALLESQRRYERMANTIPVMLYDSIITSDNISRFIYVAPGPCREILELDPDALLKDMSLVWNIIHPDDLTRFYQEDVVANKEGKEFLSEVRIITPSGHLKWLLVNSKPNPSKPGEPVVWSGYLQDITKRKQAQKEREQFYKFFQTSADLMCIANPHGRFIKTNPAFTETLGYTESELISNEIIDFVHPDDKQATLDEIEKQQLRGCTTNFENRYICKDGHVKWLSWRVTYSREEGVSYATARDITDKKQAEETLRESRSLLHTILENIPIRVFWKDLDLHYLGCDTSFAQSAGHSQPEDLLGKDDFQMCWREQAEFYRADDKLILASRKPKLNIEKQQTTPDGQTIWVRTSKAPLFNAEKEVIGLLGIDEDITERKLMEENLQKQALQLEEELVKRQVAQKTLQDQAAILKEEIEEHRRTEEALQRSENSVKNKLRAILEPEGDIGALALSDIIDFEILRSMLEAFYKITGMLGAVLDLSGNVLVAVGWQDICTKFHRCHPDTLKNCIESDTTLTNDVPIGTFKHYRCKNNMWDMVTPLVVGGRHVGNVFIGQFFYEDEILDVEVFREQARRYGFDEKEYLEALDRVPRFSREAADAGMAFYAKLTNIISTMSYSAIKMSRMLSEQIHLEGQLHQVQKMESIGQLAGGVAHDFNNMLGVILGHAEMALMKAGPSSPFSHDLQQISKAAQSSADLTRQLLTFARKQVIDPKILDLNEAVAGTLKMLRRLIGENIRLSWNPEANLWPVRVDPAQLDQILANLCVNARDAIAGIGKISIKMENRTMDENAANALPYDVVPGDYVLLSVSDDGCGMDKKVQAHIFEPFFTTKEVGGGTGLGLATVYGAVKQNHGFITFYSEAELGTVFNIYLPRASKTVDAKQKTAEMPFLRGTETILLVEDDEMLLCLETTMLEEGGYRVLAAATTELAESFAREHPGPIDLLISDMIMPVMNGRELSAMLQPLRPEMKVLFLSGYTADIISNQGVIEDEIHFLQKPFSLEVLTSKVREVLDESRAIIS